MLSITNALNPAPLILETSRNDRIYSRHSIMFARQIRRAEINKKCLLRKISTKVDGENGVIEGRYQVNIRNWIWTKKG